MAIFSSDSIVNGAGSSREHIQTDVAITADVIEGKAVSMCRYANERLNGRVHMKQVSQTEEWRVILVTEVIQSQILAATHRRHSQVVEVGTDSKSRVSFSQTSPYL